MIQKIMISTLLSLSSSIAFSQDALINNTLQTNQWRIGLSSGFGVGNLNGNLKTYFDPNILLFALGAEVGYKRHQIALNVAGNVFLNHYLLKSLEYNQVLRPAGLKLNYTWAQFTYGYTFFDNLKWSLSPYAGLVIVEVMDATRDRSKTGFQKANLSWIIGTCLDYKIGNKGAKKHKLPFESHIQTRLGVTSITYQPNLEGWSVVGSLAYTIFFFNKK